MLKRVKRIRSHVGVSRFLADSVRCGTIPRQEDIPSPYAYSLDWTVQLHAKYGPVVIVETSHRCYDVFEVPRPMIEPREYEPGEKVTCNGNPQGRILRKYSEDRNEHGVRGAMYEVRLWDGLRHVGDVCTDVHDLNLENPY